MSATQWNIRVRIDTLDRGGVVVKNMWSVGSTVTVQIEPHATVNMLKQRIALLVAAHMKHQTITSESGDELDDVRKLEECTTDGGVLILHVRLPREEEAPPVELSDDEELWGEEEAAPEALPEGDAMTKELADDEMDRQNALKGAAAELLEDGDKAGALAKLTEAIMVGAPSAMLLTKRAELLLKLKRPLAAMRDADAALNINPDSSKAYRVRGVAQRYIGRYDQAKADLDTAQKIDYEDSVAEVHSYVSKRTAKMARKAAQDAKKAAAEAPAQE